MSSATSDSGAVDAVARPGSGAVSMTVNGQPTELTEGSTLTAWLASIDKDPRTVAVELNGEIVPRARFDSVVLGAGDRLELVQFVQGG